MDSTIFVYSYLYSRIPNWIPVFLTGFLYSFLYSCVPNWIPWHQARPQSSDNSPHQSDYENARACAVRALALVNYFELHNSSHSRAFNRLGDCGSCSAESFETLRYLSKCHIAVTVLAWGRGWTVNAASYNCHVTSIEE